MPELQHRQLAAILFTDMAGYTALMAQDEALARRLRNRHREVLHDRHEAHQGEIIQYFGDGTLSVFHSAVKAVRCAIDIQLALREEPQVPLRIGIHSGEVVWDKEGIYGSAVNIASRLESFATIGSILVSAQVQNELRNQKELQFESLGLFDLKNVPETMEIFAVTNDGIVIPEKKDLKGKGKKIYKTKEVPVKSIAVLPFVNMSSDPEQEYFSDGLTEEIITDLSQLENLLVISRSSMMTFKGLNKKIKEIAEDVNVRYVLEGSVRKAGNNLRITARLIDTQKGGHLWAEKYSGTIEDIFDIQERVSKSIVKSLDIQLTHKEESQLVHHRFPNPRALEYFMQARYEMNKLTEPGLLKAVALAEQGLEIVGENALLYGTMALANLYLHHYGIRVTPIQLDKAREQAKHSLSLDPECSPAHLVNGIIEFYIEYNKQAAADIFKNILQFDKNNPDALRWLGFSYIVAGRVEEARPISERLLQLDPMTPESRSFPGQMDFAGGLIQDAIPHYEKWLQLDTDGPFPQYDSSLLFAINHEQSRSIKLLDSLISTFSDSIYSKFAFFFRSALSGDKRQTLRYATEELKTNAEFYDWLPLGMTIGYAFISEKDEAVKWCRIMLKQGTWFYQLIQKIEGLKDHPGFQEVMDEMKRRSDAFVI